MIIFKKKDHDDEYMQMKIQDGATWVDVTDRFVEFLQGCGYIVRGIDVAEHLMGEYGFQKEPEVFINGSKVSLPIDQPRSEIKRKKGKRRAKQK